MCDLRYSLRQISRNRLFSLIVILLLAIGIGANTLIFSLVDALLLTRLPVRHPNNLFLLEKFATQWVRPGLEFSYGQFQACQQRSDLFLDVLAEQTFGANNRFTVTENGEVRIITTQIVSPNYFSSLGVTAIIGRVLTAWDANTVSRDVPTVISYQFWQSQFGGDAGVIGKTIRLKHFPFLIVGVLPNEFHSLDIDRAPDLRVPISAANVLFGRPVDDARNFQVVPAFRILARLRPNIMPTVAASALLAQTQSIEESEIRQRNRYRSHPWPQEVLYEDIQNALAYHLVLQPASTGISQLREQFSRALEVLMASVGLLFLIVCANVTGLLLTKWEQRQKELSVRMAMGANRWRLGRQLITENLTLVIPGALLGVVFTYCCSPLVVTLLPNARGLDQHLGSRLISIHFDTRVLLFVVFLVCASVFLSGANPARVRATTDLATHLKGATRGDLRLVWNAMPVGVQVAFSTLLMIEGVLMLRSYWTLQHLNPGFDRAHIVSFTMDLKDAGETNTQKITFLRDAKTQVSELTGIQSVAYASSGLMRGAAFKSTVAPRGIILPASTFLNVSFNGVTPSFFETLGIPLLAGRNLTLNDQAADPRPIVVNKAFASLLFPGQDPVGKYIVAGSDGTKPPSDVIVGVVGTAKYRSMREQNPPIIYVLLNEGVLDSVVMYVRSDKDPIRAIGAIRRILRKLDPGVPITELVTLEQEVEKSLWQERLVTLLLGFFSLTATTLAGLGIYGALTYSITHRTRELGIRIAIGAGLRDIFLAVAGRLLVAVALGIISGLLMSDLVLGVTRHLLFGVTPLDPTSIAIAGLSILLCVVVAVAIPLWRLSMTDAAAALRQE